MKKISDLFNCPDFNKFITNPNMEYKEKYYRLYFWFFCTPETTGFEEVNYITEKELEYARMEETCNQDILVFANRFLLLALITCVDMHEIYEFIAYIYSYKSLRQVTKSE